MGTCQVDNLEYFTDKIRLYEGMSGKNNVTGILWKLKKIRDDISHGRIHALAYEGKDLLLRATKEKILMDYLRAVNKPDHSNVSDRKV